MTTVQFDHDFNHIFALGNGLEITKPPSIPFKNWYLFSGLPPHPFNLISPQKGLRTIHSPVKFIVPKVASEHVSHSALSHENPRKYHVTASPFITDQRAQKRTVCFPTTQKTRGIEKLLKHLENLIQYLYICYWNLERILVFWCNFILRLRIMLESEITAEGVDSPHMRQFPTWTPKKMTWFFFSVPEVIYTFFQIFVVEKTNHRRIQRFKQSNVLKTIAFNTWKKKTNRNWFENRPIQANEERWNFHFFKYKQNKEHIPNFFLY